MDGDSVANFGSEKAVGEVGFVGDFFGFYREVINLTFFEGDQMGVSKNRGTPKWMIKIMENLTKMNDLVVPMVPLFSETPK